MTQQNSSFSPQIPGLQIAWDSTSLGTFKECPRKYYYSIVLGWTPRQESVHLWFGILYHQIHERYAHARTSGKTHREAMILAIREAMIKTWDKKLSRPVIFDHPAKTRYGLIRAFVWHSLQFGENDPMKTITLRNGKPAVELSFRFETEQIAPDGQRYIYCGHLDKVAEFNNQYWVLDHKTSGYSITGDDFFDRYSPDNQMSGYTFAGKIIYNIPVQGVIVDAAQIMVTFSRFRRGFAIRTPDTIDEWYYHTLHYMKMASVYAQSQFWPMNDKSCGMYGGCPFRKICGKSPIVREQWLQSGYTKRTWDPLKIRGDI